MNKISLNERLITGVLTTKTNSIENDYKKIKSIGKGINGKVYLYKHRMTKQKVAMKVCYHIQKNI